MATEGITNFKLPTFSSDFEILNSVIYSMEGYIQRSSTTLFNQSRVVTSRAPVSLSQVFQDMAEENTAYRLELQSLRESMSTNVFETNRIEAELRSSTEKLAILESDLTASVNRDEYNLVLDRVKSLEVKNGELTEENDRAIRSVTDLNTASIRL
jgi:regulator of replication initiation timing